MTDQDARGMMLTILGIRAPEATVCPSEVARALLQHSGNDGADEDWRSAMPMVHAAIDRLLGEKLVRLSWKGKSWRHEPALIGSAAACVTSNQNEGRRSPQSDTLNDRAGA